MPKKGPSNYSSTALSTSCLWIILILCHQSRNVAPLKSRKDGLVWTCLIARIDCRVLYDCLRWWVDTEGYKAVICWVVLQRAATTAGWWGGQLSLHSGGGAIVRDQKLKFTLLKNKISAILSKPPPYLFWSKRLTKNKSTLFSIKEIDDDSVMMMIHKILSNQSEFDCIVFFQGILKLR